MKKLLILLTVIFLPLVAFAQTSGYDIDTVKKFDRVIEILKNAKSSFKEYNWWVTGTASGSDGLTLQRFYDTERIKNAFETEGLNTFLEDKNNRIILSAVADYVTDHRVYEFHNDYETLLTIGINSVEAAVRTSEIGSYLFSAKDSGVVHYYHCYVVVTVTPFGGHVAAISELKDI